MSKDFCVCDEYRYPTYYLRNETTGEYDLLISQAGRLELTVDYILNALNMSLDDRNIADEKMRDEKSPKCTRKSTILSLEIDPLLRTACLRLI